jgi:hypothetical protein
MITTQKASELVKIGERLRGAYLVLQGGYTLGIAQSEGPALAALLPANCLDDVARVCTEVDKARQDKTIAAVESKQATNNQQAMVRELKVWRRQAAKCIELCQLAGADLPDGIIQGVHAHTVPALLEATSKTLGLLDQNKAALDAVGPNTQTLIDQGHELYQALLQADSTQEQTRAKDLPAAVIAYYAKKGELYVGLKMINAAGHQLHAQDPMVAARFNLTILNRRHNQGAAAPAPTPPAKAPTQTANSATN